MIYRKRGEERKEKGKEKRERKEKKRRRKEDRYTIYQKKNIHKYIILVESSYLTIYLSIREFPILCPAVFGTVSSMIAWTGREN